MRLAYIIILFLLAGQAQAVDTFQKSKGYTGNCTDTTTRVDGSALDPDNNPDDVISKVMYYVIDNTVGDITAPLITVTMIGGCLPVQIGTKELTASRPGAEVIYYRVGVTYLDDQLVSEVSPGNPFKVINANPNAPGQMQ